MEANNKATIIPRFDVSLNKMEFNDEAVTFDIKLLDEVGEPTQEVDTTMGDDEVASGEIGTAKTTTSTIITSLLSV